MTGPVGHRERRHGLGGHAPRVGERAPRFELPDAGGTVRRSADYYGRPLVVILTRHVH